MFCKHTLLPLALTLFVSGVPMQDTGARIALHRRGDLTSEDGIFNYDKAFRHSVRIHK